MAIDLSLGLRTISDTVSTRDCIIVGNSALAEGLRDNFGEAGPALHAYRSGAQALERLSEHSVVVVDDDLQDMTHLEFLKRVRNRSDTAAIPLIAVSRSNEEIDRVLAFELGADDFMAKPVSIRELALRVYALLRRATSKPQSPELAIAGPLEVDIPAHRATLHGQPITLTPIEFKLLADLIMHPGQVRSRELLLDKVWGQSSRMETRRVDTHIKRLRDKLGSVGPWIETVRGVGYRFRRLS